MTGTSIVLPVRFLAELAMGDTGRFRWWWRRRSRARSATRASDLCQGPSGPGQTLSHVGPVEALVAEWRGAVTGQPDEVWDRKRPAPRQPARRG